MQFKMDMSNLMNIPELKFQCIRHGDDFFPPKNQVLSFKMGAWSNLLLVLEYNGEDPYTLV